MSHVAAWLDQIGNRLALVGAAEPVQPRQVRIDDELLNALEISGNVGDQCRSLLQQERNEQQNQRDQDHDQDG